VQSIEENFSEERSLLDTEIISLKTKCEKLLEEISKHTATHTQDTELIWRLKEDIIQYESVAR
jgi:hypothetical protein